MDARLAKKHDTLEDVICQLERRFGPGIVYRLSHARPKIGDLAIPTGSVALDKATGIGGVPRGRITEIIGPASSGKTTLAYHLIANAQKDQGLAVFVDAEHRADADAMARCGVDLADLILAVPGTTEEALEMADLLIRCDALDILVFSSLSALFYLPRYNPPGVPNSVRYLMSKALRKIAVSLKGSPTAMVFAGPVSFCTSLRIELLPIRPIFQSGGDVGGLRVRASVMRNRFASSFAMAELEILEERGIHHEAELFDLGYSLGIIERLPLGFSYRREVLGKSRGRAIAALEQHKQLAERLEQDLLDDERS